MKNIGLIAKRDLNSMFKNSAIAYIILFIFYAISSFFFYTFITQTQRAELIGFFQNMYIIMIFAIPILTARSFIDEKKNNTMELLLTSPISKTEIYFGKFFAQFVFYLVMILPTLIYLIFVVKYGKPAAGPIITSFLGYLLTGAVFIAVGLFFSALFSNQFAAGIVGVVFLLFLYIFSWALGSSASSWFSTFVKDISIVTHLTNTFSGLLDFNDILYFFLFFGFFAYMTVSIMDVKYN